jgi:hypothetical protein
MNHARPVFDEKDATILADRQALLDAETSPRVGDFVVFSDGVTRRVSYVWRFGNDPSTDVQTSDLGGGSFYLGNGYVSFSGSLYNSVPGSTLTRTDEAREGNVWFFHHDWAEAHNGVHTTAQFRVYHSTKEAPR